MRKKIMKNQNEQVVFEMTIIAMIAIKHYQLKNILIKLDYTINDPKKSDKWKIQLTIAINFMSPKDTD